MDLQIIKHNDILFRDVLRAISIKSVAWPHPVESQVKWIVDNMLPEDYHVFLTEDGVDKAYMTLSSVVGTLNEERVNFLGAGCVCALERGKGYGGRLMLYASEYLTQRNIPGLLFCKPGLVQFYSKNGWQIIPWQKVSLFPAHDGVMVMTCNCGPVDSFDYSDRFF